MEPEGSLPLTQALATFTYSEADQSSPYPHPTSWKFILILSFHLLLGPSGVLPSVFPTKTLYARLLSAYMLLAPPIPFFLIWSPD